LRRNVYLVNPSKSRASSFTNLKTLNDRAQHNKSLDASGITGLIIDNLSVTWLSPAASTSMKPGRVKR
jgi:hypothetical protein